MTAGKKRNNKRKRVVLLVMLVIALIAVVFLRKGGPVAENTPVCKVERGPLTISVINSGTIHSRDKLIITCELEGRSILTWMIDEGTNVQTGDLLAEFDADEIIEDFEQQEVRAVNAETAYEVAREKVKITEGDCEAAELDCEVELELAQMELEKYRQGDYPQQVRQIEADIALASEEVQRAAEKVEWSQRLAEEDYLTRTELQADQLALKRKQIDLEMAQTKMNLLTNYTVREKRALLDSNLRKAERKFERVRWQNMSSLRTANAQLFAREREYYQATSRLEKIRFEIDKSKIYAPTNGFILHASTVKMRKRWWTRPLTVGSEVSKREELIYMPLESGMVVEMMIPEASLNKVFERMPAKVKIDAFPGRVFKGTLGRIGILPDAASAQLNPGLKLYKCEVECNFKDVIVRPGMSCDVELITEVHEDALYLPVQCVVRVDDQPRVYVQEGNGYVPRNVEIGLDNNTMVHILGGVEKGEVVMLAPPIAPEAKDETKPEEPLPPEPPPGTRVEDDRKPRRDDPDDNGTKSDPSAETEQSDETNQHGDDRSDVNAGAEQTRRGAGKKEKHPAGKGADLKGKG